MRGHGQGSKANTHKDAHAKIELRDRVCHSADGEAKRHDDRSAGQHDPRAESVEQHPDDRSDECPHDRAEQEGAGRQSPAPAKLFDDRDQKERKRVARAKGYADGKKSDSDDDPGIIALQDTAWGDLGFTYGHTVLPAVPQVR